MSMLAFLPWLRINEEINVEDIRLTQFDDNKFKEQKEKINNILNCYKAYGRPIGTATFVLLEGKSIFEDYTQEEVSYLYYLIDILAFSAISNRSYFGHGYYCNHANFEFVIQGFNEHSQGVTINSRRRDGGSMNYVPMENCTFLLPPYVPQDRVQFDLSLAKALIEFRKSNSDEWQNYNDAIFYYNRANTDSSHTPEQQELVMLLSSFQRILNCGSNEDDLVNKFLSVLQEFESIDVMRSIRLQKVANAPKGNILREVWIKDFFRLRGDFAHGKNSSLRPSIWKIGEHLLLATYILPLVVKVELSKRNFYKMSEDDITYLNIFDELLDAYLFVINEDDDKNEFAWNKIYNKARISLLANKLYESLYKKI